MPSMRAMLFVGQALPGCMPSTAEGRRTRSICMQSERSISRRTALTLLSLCANPFLFTTPTTAAPSRLSKCQGDVPCISTSSVGNPSKFSPPWTYAPQTDDAVTAWGSLKTAVASLEGASVAECEDEPTYYMRVEMKNRYGAMDDIEFKLNKVDEVVTYRSAAREAVYIYPIQTPIGGGRIKKRLEEVRQILGWQELGGEEE